MEQVDQNAAKCVDERAALANLIANLTLDTEENKTILKQLKKANASLTQELKECRTNLDETGRALGKATSCRDSCLIALQNKQNEFEKYKAFNDRTIDYDILQTKLNETLGLLARKDIDIKEGLKTKAYEISVVNQKHDELVKRSLLTKSQFEGQLKEKSKIISDLKVKEDIDKRLKKDKPIKLLEAAENILLVAAHEEAETIHNMTTENKLYFQAEKEAIFLILTGIGDEIYSTVDACNTAKEMWTAIERLQQGESLNVQDVKTNLFWEFGKFTSRDGESMESYYSRFYKLMNELTRNNLQVSPMQVNVQFLQQLQPEWSRFVTVVKQREEIDKVSYHRLFDLLKQFQNEVNDIRSERLARSANPLALLAAAQPYSDNYYQAPKPQRSNAPSYMQSSSIRPSATTRHKGKEIAKPVTPQFYCTNLPQQPSTSSTLGTRLKIPHQVRSATKWDTMLYCKGFGTHAKEMHEAKAAEQADWLEDTDEEIDEQELEAHYSYMAKIQEVSPEESSSTSQPLEHS
ncbi:hypothetical protein Tco_0420342 [Tanacetum coccineum]